jgi:hypothetical protein
MDETLDPRRGFKENVLRKKRKNLSVAELTHQLMLMAHRYRDPCFLPPTRSNLRMLWIGYADTQTQLPGRDFSLIQIPFCIFLFLEAKL